MNKKLLALMLVLCIAAAGFAGCKAKKNIVCVAVTDENGVTVTDENGKTLTKTAEAQTDKNGKSVSVKVTDKSGKTVTDASGKAVTEYVTVSSTTTKKSASSTTSKAASTTKAESSWKAAEDGTYSKDGVKADVVRYDLANVADGESLIKQLVAAGLKDGKVISSSKTASQVVYIVSGSKTTGSDKSVMFFKFQYIIKNEQAYLITFSAAKQDMLGGDFSYIVNNAATLAK